LRLIFSSYVPKNQCTLSLLEFAIYFMYKTNKELYREYTYEFDKRNTYLQLAGYTIPE